jgi:hypothetical protein
LWDGNGRQQELDREIDRYREASDAALAQLEWVVGYLYKLRKPQIAWAINRNRQQILKNVEARG